MCIYCNGRDEQYIQLDMLLKNKRYSYVQRPLDTGGKLNEIVSSRLIRTLKAQWEFTPLDTQTFLRTTNLKTYCGREEQERRRPKRSSSTDISGNCVFIVQIIRCNWLIITMGGYLVFKQTMLLVCFKKSHQRHERYLHDFRKNT